VAPNAQQIDLAAAAEALSAELSRYEALAAGLRRERLDSEKHLRRAVQTIGELERSEARLATCVEDLVRATNEARERHAAHAESVRECAEDVRRRGDVLSGLLIEWRTVGEEAAQVNTLVKGLRDGSPEEARATLDRVEERLAGLAADAGRLGAAAEAEAFGDLAHQADALRQQLVSLHGKLRRLRPDPASGGA
jgi:chromosome segregation ATPase